jgi:hypothetical protein
MEPATADRAVVTALAILEETVDLELLLLDTQLALLQKILQLLPEEALTLVPWRISNNDN